MILTGRTWVLAETIVAVLDAETSPAAPYPRPPAPGPVPVTASAAEPLEPKLPGGVNPPVIRRWRKQTWAWREHQRLAEVMRWRGARNDEMHGLGALALPPGECAVS